MKLLLVCVDGLTNGWAKRPDVAAQISNLMELGGYVPVFPEFPALAVPSQACLLTGRRAARHGVLRSTDPFDTVSPYERLSYDRILAGDLPAAGWISIPSPADELRRAGPRHPSAAEFVRRVDARIGELAASARRSGAGTVVVSASPVYPAAAAIDLSPALAGVEVHVDQQVAHVYGPPDRIREIARAVRSIDRGVKVLSSAEDRSLYHIDHERAAPLVLIAPLNKHFGAASVGGAQGHLPLMMDDYGVLVADIPLPGIQRRPFIALTQAAALLSELLAK
jgi:hypothetical protein